MHNDVISAEATRREAMVARDRKALEEILADDLVWIHSSGMIESKASFVARLASGTDRYLSIRPRDESIRRFGSVAIVSGVVEIDAVARGTARAIFNRFTNVWLLTDSRWRLVSAQSTKVQC